MKPEFIVSALFSNIEGKFGLIAFNPPYVPSDKLKYPETDGGKKGRIVIDRFLNEFPAHLGEKGKCYFLQSSLNGINETEKSLEGRGLEVEIVSRKKLFFEELVVFKVFYI